MPRPRPLLALAAATQVMLVGSAGYVAYATWADRSSPFSIEAIGALVQWSGASPTDDATSPVQADNKGSPAADHAPQAPDQDRPPPVDPQVPAIARSQAVPQLELRRPSMRVAEPPAAYAVMPYPEHKGRVAISWGFSSPVFRAPDAKRRVSGLVRRNTVIAVERFVSGKGCKRSWYQLKGGGFVCAGDGFAVRDEISKLPEALQTKRPGVESWLPYIYAKIETPKAKILYRLPNEAELAGEREMPIQELSSGAQFVAAERLVRHAGSDFVRSPRGSFVALEDVRLLEPPTMRGELLGESWQLPIAFVHEEQALLHDPANLEVVGSAEKFARFEIEDAFERDGLNLVVGKDGYAVPADAVRVARKIRRPRGVSRKSQWIHVDLSSQTLVAYEGDRPILATLISSGKPGYDTPLGTFRVHKKYTTQTMSGEDDVAGTFEVDQVPWTMYYFGSYAIHGVYWHDNFGKVRSHGCTNIPPVDARFLFYWSKPEMPPGWHARVGVAGPTIHVTT